MCPTPWTVAHWASLCITSPRSLPKLVSIKSVMPSNHLILCVSFSRLHSFQASGSFPMSQFFTSGGQNIGRFSFIISPSNEYSGLISFRMDWFEFLAVQRTLKSLLQCDCSKASILHCSVFFIVQLSHPYLTTGETIALIRWTFVGKVMSLLLNMLSRRRQWHPTPVLLPGKSMDRGAW